MRKIIISGFMAACAAFTLLADGVTRSVTQAAGGYKVTLSWGFSGHVESDLVIEERMPVGWSVDSTTVTFDALDASWFSGVTARFAVKSERLSEAGSISFTVTHGEGATSGSISGDWQMYLSGQLRKSIIVGGGTLDVVSESASNGDASSSGVNGTGESVAGGTETAVKICGFKVIDGGVIEISYGALASAGTLVVYGCSDFTSGWKEVKRESVAAGAGKVHFNQTESAGSRFFKLKLINEGE